MKQKNNPLILILRHWRLALAALCVLIIALLGWRIYSKVKSGAKLFETTHTEAIDTTPEEIRAIRDIGEWEFLSIATEELIERHEAHTLGDRHLVRIYHGTLRIGIDMKQADESWFQTDSTTAGNRHRGTALITLPPVALLDTNFIDEARTTTFYEKGTFSAQAKEDMLHQAAEAMKRRTLTKRNLDQARKSAEEQFTKLFKALGFDEVVIHYKTDETTKLTDPKQE